MYVCMYYICWSFFLYCSTARLSLKLPPQQDILAMYVCMYVCMYVFDIMYVLNVLLVRTSEADKHDVGNTLERSNRMVHGMPSESAKKKISRIN